MLDPDRPIQTTQQDRLGRTTFAKYLARCILDHHNPESLVIGLYGGWGTGKTSIINLMLEELRSAANNMADDEKPIILNFSPWSYSGQNQLIYAFFRRLSSVIRQSSHLKDSNELVELLELYISFFTHKPIPVALRKKKSFFQRLLHPYNNDNTTGWESGKDLTLVKAELNSLLLKQKYKIIIIIDNISRIEQQEIKQIFQIVKSMGDYVNTIYLLSTDKKHIHHVIGEEGEAYLEKIVQLPFDVPAISQQDLEIILLDKLHQLTKVMPEDAWNSHYWADIYYPSLKYFFTSCRDITHYINSISFGFERIKDLINPVDFFAITALSVFEPELYSGIRDNKDVFTDLIYHVSQPNEKKQEDDRLRCDEILSRAKRISPDKIKLLIMHLFPRLNTLYQISNTQPYLDNLARIDKRICCSDIFDICFRLSIPAGQISTVELNAILASTHDQSELSLALLGLNQDGRITQFLDMLTHSVLSTLPTYYIQNLINALLDGGDLFPEGEETSVTFNTATKIHHIILELFNKIHTPEEKTKLLINAINQSMNSLYSIIQEITLLEKQEIGNINQLKSHAIDKISYWAKIDRLVEHPKLFPILLAWKTWDTSNAYYHYVEKIVRTEKGLLAFLCAALKDPIDEATSKLEKNSNWSKALNNIDTFISINEIEPKVKAIFEHNDFEKLREREQLAVLIFLDTMKSDTIKIIPKTS